MFDDVTLDGIRTPALACVTDDLQPFLQEINNEKLAPDNELHHVRGTPVPLTRYMDGFIDRIPPGAKGLALEGQSRDWHTHPGLNIVSAN